MRIVQAVPLLLFVSALTFFLQLFIPGDAARSIGGLTASPQAIAALRHRLHLDQPVWERYWAWLKDAVHGDLGRSISNNESVSGTLNTRLGVTLSLVIATTLLALVVGVVLGMASVRGGRTTRLAADSASIAGMTIPAFWVGLLGIWVFNTRFDLLPANGYVFFGTSAGGWARSLVLPVAALAFALVTVIAKQTREQFADVLGRDFVRNLRANGVSERSILFKHSLRHVSVTVLTVAGNNLIGLLGSAVVIEELFGLPGLGSAAVTAASSGDIPVIQGVAVYFTLIVVGLNLLLDLAIGWLNPQAVAA
ncbi:MULTISPECIES: ABC transporter permease [unclassified Streptomyces]|uniref:ABC transporter permease n=1 Tax=unclassified Streptomyces TaxID=2593676 RepID=UPI00190A0ACD|nr:MULTISPECIES: ABC transporter permease [unclassified Streptomyces]MBK3564982.1 ABC transporter permease [Streptomyces sp. MBT62]MBK6011271.1 ABC transporter permease [Streptomyces sp. MBT53]